MWGWWGMAQQGESNKKQTEEEKEKETQESPCTREDADEHVGLLRVD